MGASQFKKAVKLTLLKAKAQQAFHLELKAMNKTQRAVVDKAMEAGWKPKQMDGDVVWLDHPSLETVMKIETRTTAIYKTFDDRIFTDEGEAKEHDATLLDEFAKDFTLGELVAHMRETNDTAGISYVARMLARVCGYTAEM